ncbi:amphi-Trp domain-containing protein [Halogeometricum sp. S1BR25-6]|uniref:Amphi-Trp domain-containing protein n=1 Tax=Halogeometricum salsisoli TaxID=2950536 RepID=A0ABU2G8J8_9EURY|nr:amphi-Trp domain-containing protein [Halogeometricum sp. S1BR25-6]MDS0297130.1 amphi-Trp domain-containing protein [Halogeometricum sp. S1BR25-6]
MVSKTLNAEKLSREETADRLRALADAIEGNDDDADVRVGNKQITLRPRSSVGYEIGVRERSSVLRGSRESVTVTLEWKARKD